MRRRGRVFGGEQGFALLLVGPGLLVLVLTTTFPLAYLIWNSFQTLNLAMPFLDGFAGLLVELHTLGCFWGDCSLSNVLYRYDAAALSITMVDAETVEMHDELTPGQRAEDREHD